MTERCVFVGEREEILESTEDIWRTGGGRLNGEEEGDEEEKREVVGEG